MNYRYNNLLEYISKSNRKLSKTYTLYDDCQRIHATGFINQNYMKFPLNVSFCAVILTSDNKYITCSRNDSFLFSEIKRLNNVSRKRYLFSKYSRYLRRWERKQLSNELDINTNNNIDYDYSNIIFPGGMPNVGETVLECLSREIKEEINMDSKDIFIDSRFFVHLYIDDIMINKFFNTILFFGETYLSSKHIRENFISNNEVKSLIFLNRYDKGICGDIIRFVIAVSKIKCFGNRGNKREMLYKK
ncbi:decapping enzyme [Cotia virus SPAn232]|uniref:Decapping enzyme n=2 Tax=Cotia virus TaxID=39444 RepID=H6TA76_9POXV|nr:decapping enzyme [Cotia virus SPAn232]ADT91116.1 decapping enzyme [Cotia virus SPAn232]AIT70719.1 decapping enzyme [Cotia virus]